MSEKGLFRGEERLINHSEAMLSALEDGVDPPRADFEALLRAYRKLRRQMSRVVRISDRQQDELRSLNTIKDDLLSQLETLSVTDALTGIANRRRFDQFLNFEWKRAMRTRQPIALLLMDIDHFKLYNDNYGHDAGDQCLIEIAELLQSKVRRPTDLFARYGGEEFAYVLPDTCIPGAEITANLLRQAVLERAVPHEYSLTNTIVTVSIGVAALIPARNDEPGALIRAADTFLYEAKQGGRNQCRCGPDPICPPSAKADRADTVGLA